MPLLTPVLVAPHAGYNVRLLASLNGEIYGATDVGELLKWDGVSAWVSKAPQLLGYTTSNSLASFNNKMYMIADAGALLEWDGVSAWVVKAGPPPSSVDAVGLYTFGGELYTGGYAFNDGRLYKWNGINAWVEVAGNLNTEHLMRSAVEHNSSLWVFTDSLGYLGELVGGTVVQRASSFQAVTIPVGLISLGGEIYGSETASTMILKKWDGVSAWQTVVPSLAPPNRSGKIFLHNGEIYVFSIASSNVPVYKWDGLNPGNWIQVTTTIPEGIGEGISLGSAIFILGNTLGNLYRIADPPIQPNSITSGEAFGTVIVEKTTQPYSSISLPPPVSTKGDIRISFDQYAQYADLILADRDVDRDGGFETAVLITLLTDKRADEEDSLPDDGGYKGGWWGDSVPVVPDYRMGTKLWLLQRSKTTTDIPARAEEYLKEGFQWLIDDGIVESFEVSAERLDVGVSSILSLSLSFKKSSEQTVSYKFYFNWQEQILRRQ